MLSAMCLLLSAYLSALNISRIDHLIESRGKSMTEYVLLYPFRGMSSTQQHHSRHSLTDSPGKNDKFKQMSTQQGS